MIAIIDYGMGNLRSVQKGFERMGHEVVVTNDAKTIMDASKVVLPGVGAFPDCMRNLREYGLIDAVHRTIRSGKPFLGICLGLQLLFTTSSEGGVIDGLDLISGKVIKLPDEVKTPQIGWNTAAIVKAHPLLEGLAENPYFYFVHSYIPQPREKDVIIATTDYGTTFPSIVAKKNLFATQFHPEKSSKNGSVILSNFIKIAKR
jgi:glutamine amidotransferase